MTSGYNEPSDKIAVPVAPPILVAVDNTINWQPVSTEGDGVVLTFSSGFNLSEEDLDTFFEAGANMVAITVDGHTYNYKVDKPTTSNNPS